jgi:hypothetical protein
MDIGARLVQMRFGIARVITVLALGCVFDSWGTERRAETWLGNRPVLGEPGGPSTTRLGSSLTADTTVR